jgi:hypothetical protein
LLSLWLLTFSVIITRYPYPTPNFAVSTPLVNQPPLPV